MKKLFTLLNIVILLFIRRLEGTISINQEGERYLLCSYPNYPKYTGGDASLVSSYVSAAP